MMETTHLTELEARLGQPDGALLKKAQLQELETLAWNLKQRLHSGLPREDFAVLQAAAHAVHAAQEVLTDWPVQRYTGIF